MQCLWADEGDFLIGLLACLEWKGSVSDVDLASEHYEHDTRT